MGIAGAEIWDSHFVLLYSPDTCVQYHGVSGIYWQRYPHVSLYDVHDLDGMTPKLETISVQKGLAPRNPHKSLLCSAD